MDIFKNTLKIALEKLHSELKISNDFIVGIHDEKNSWSFISKFAQFTEGFFTKILVQHLNEKDTYGTISNLPQIARLNLAFDLKLITKEQKFLFLTVAEIRNDYIHNISNIEVNLPDYLKTLKADRVKEIHKRFSHFALGENINTKEDFIENCVNAIFTACALEIARIHGKSEGDRAKIKHAQQRADQALKLLPQKASDAMFMEDGGMVRDYIKAAKEVLKKAGVFKAQFVKDTLT
ncbi:MAG: hypothetical protein H3C26_17685 [Rhodocyclaceae bacterium]|nr:hypothetical protein [Rhodocyclaceae bacterium]